MTPSHGEITPLRLKDKSQPPPPSGKYPAKAHARKVARWIADRQKHENGTSGSSVIYLESQKTHMIEVGFDPPSQS